MGPTTVEAAVSVQPPARSSRHPLSLPSAEYEALMLQSPQSPPQMSPVEPASASTKSPAPAPSAATVSKPVSAQPPSSLAGLRPGTPTLPTTSAVNVSVSAASSSTAVIVAHTSPKPHQPRSFKRRAGSMSSPSVTTQKQPALSSSVRGYPVTRSSAKAAAAAAVTAPTTLPIPSSAPTHADLQQFALVHSSDSSLSPQRPLQIVEAPQSAETIAAVRCESEVPSRSQTPPLSAALPSTVTTIVLDDTPTPPLRSCRSALHEDDEWDRAERAIMQATRSSAVDAPVAVGANPLAMSALSTRALSACALTTSAPTTSAQPTTVPVRSRSPSPTHSASPQWSSDTASQPWPNPQPYGSFTMPPAPPEQVPLLSAPRAPPETIDPAQAAVTIAIETSRFVIDGYAGVQMKLVNRIVVIDATGVLADWRDRCEAPIILTENTILNAPDPAIVRRTPLKQYTEMVRDMSALLTRRYMVFYDRDAVLDALLFALPLERTTDVGHVMHLRNDALRRGGTC